jgi:hypothetical protein
MILDELIHNRASVNAAICAGLAKFEADWGIKVTRYEVQDISFNPETQNSMQMQSSAERVRRAQVKTSLQSNALVRVCGSQCCAGDCQRGRACCCRQSLRGTALPVYQQQRRRAASDGELRGGQSAADCARSSGQGAGRQHGRLCPKNSHRNVRVGGIISCRSISSVRGPSLRRHASVGPRGNRPHSSLRPLCGTLTNPALRPPKRASCQPEFTTPTIP